MAIVARLVTDAILEHFRAGSTSRGGVASVPRVDPQVAISAVKLASELVALRVADPIPGLYIAPLQLAHPQLLLEVFYGKPIRVICPCCDVHPSWCIQVEYLAVPSSVFHLAEALIATSLVCTTSIATTRVVNATLIDSVNLTF